MTNRHDSSRQLARKTLSGCCYFTAQEVRGTWSVSLPPNAIPGYLRAQSTPAEINGRIDTSTPAAGGGAAPATEGTAVIGWSESTHDSLLFDSDQGVAYVLSLQPYGLRNHRLQAATLKRLLEHGVILPKSVPDMTTHMYDILSCVTGVRRTAAEGQALLNGAYCLTPDNLLKILALYARVRCGLPVALMGECGCGKTMLLRYLCAWLDVPLQVLDVHGGTTEADIIAAVGVAEVQAVEETQRRKAAQVAAVSAVTASRGDEASCVESAADQETACNADDDEASGVDTVGSDQAGTAVPTTTDSNATTVRLSATARQVRPLVFLFLDEVNTCPHLGLVHELLCRHSVHGRLVHPGVLVLTALNPRRRRAPRPDGESSPGLVYNGQQAKADDMADLVYRVHPVSPTLLNFVFDFGALGVHVEDDYVASMVKAADPEAPSAMHALMAALIVNAQAFTRTAENDSSAASLRDVRRCLDLFVWFRSKLTAKRDEGQLSASAICMTLGCDDSG